MLCPFNTQDTAENPSDPTLIVFLLDNNVLAEQTEQAASCITRGTELLTPIVSHHWRLKQRGIKDILHGGYSRKSNSTSVPSQAAKLKERWAPLQFVYATVTPKVFPWSRRRLQWLMNCMIWFVWRHTIIFKTSKRSEPQLWNFFKRFENDT